MPGPFVSWSPLALNDREVLVLRTVHSHTHTTLCTQFQGIFCYPEAHQGIWGTESPPLLTELHEKQPDHTPRSLIQDLELQRLCKLNVQGHLAKIAFNMVEMALPF